MGDHENTGAGTTTSRPTTTSSSRSTSVVQEHQEEVTAEALLDKDEDFESLPLDNDGIQLLQEDDASGSLIENCREIAKISIPIVVSEIFQNTLPIVDLAFVGQLGKDELAAAALATVWFNLWNATMLGFATAIDTLLSQAYGAQKYTLLGIWAGTGIMVIMGMCCVMAGLLALCAPVMDLLGQDPAIAQQAGEFSYRLIPGIFPLYAFKVLIKHLQTQNILLPGVLIGILANLFNIGANWLLIFGLDLGLGGAPLATTLTRFIEFVLVLLYFWYQRESEVLSRSWPTFKISELKSKHAMTTFLGLAGSGALSFTAEAWSFEVTTVLAGLLGTVELDAHIITLSVATFLYLSFPFSIGVASSIRVGQLMGEGKPSQAQLSSVASFLSTFLVQALLIVMLLPCSNLLGGLFSNDDEISELISELIPISCIFMMGDSIQSTAGGVLRGLGQQRLVFYLNIVGFWLLGVPMGTTLTFVADIGVKGLWYGMSIGIYSSACIGLYLLRCRTDWTLEAKRAHSRMRNASSTQEAGNTILR